MKKRSDRLFILFFALTITAWARLGETEEQSKQRYGEPVNESSDKANISPMIDGAVHHTYKFQGWRLRCAFIEGKAVRIQYEKSSGKDVKTVIQDDELQAILAGEAGSGKWKPAKPANLGALLLGSLVQEPEFINSNGNIARMALAKQLLILEAPAAAAFIKARDEAKEQKRKAVIPKF